MVKDWSKDGLQTGCEFMANNYSYLVMKCSGPIARLHLRVLAHNILTAQFKYYFLKQNGATFKLYKIVNYFPMTLEIWNHVEL